MENYECIVIGGTGGIGSAALYHLAKRGVRVLGIDRFPPGHDRGSSHGDTRVIRMAYFEHPDYVPLLKRAYRLWDELSEMVGEPLLVRTGILQVGPQDGEVISGVLASSRTHGLHVEQLSPHDAQGRFPGFVFPSHMVALFESHAGYLKVEQCARAHANLALKHHAKLNIGESFLKYETDAKTVMVYTDKNTYSCERLVIAPGAWAPEVMADVGVPFNILKKTMFWYKTKTPHYEIDRRCPIFLYEIPDGLFYGFPQIGLSEMKLAEHTGGEEVQSASALDRSLNVQEQKRVESFFTRYLPGVSLECSRFSVCMYTMTPDSHFVVDKHPRNPNVVFVSGLSGHGFKFATVLGEVLADLVTENKTDHPIGFFGLNRFPRNIDREAKNL